VLGSEFGGTLHCFLRFDCEFVPTDRHKIYSNSFTFMMTIRFCRTLKFGNLQLAISIKPAAAGAMPAKSTG
jgi:hypothetical protein